VQVGWKHGAEDKIRGSVVGENMGGVADGKIGGEVRNLEPTSLSRIH
jgi:hypothetical protein